MSPQREFDIVLYGATGFVGKLTAEYLAKAGGDARIALAGRSRTSWRPSGRPWGKGAVLAADRSRRISSRPHWTMASRAQVVVTTVGPYNRYGMPLVAACAAAGTDYADSPVNMLMRESIDRYHKQAIDTGARIVHACGPIPSLRISLFSRCIGGPRMTRRASRRDHLRGAKHGRWVVGWDHRFDHRCGARGVLRSGARAARRPVYIDTDRVAEPELGPEPDIRAARRQIAPELDGMDWGSSWHP